MTTPHEQMREALEFAENEMRYANWNVEQSDNSARQVAYFKVKQALAATPEPAPIAPLTDDELNDLAGIANAQWLAGHPDEHMINIVGKVVHDALIAKNGGKP